MITINPRSFNFSSLKTAASVIALGAFLTGVGVLTSLILSRGDQQGIEIIPNPSNPSISSNPSSAILVDVAGAVENPGVYRLPADSRFNDALIAAGGLSANSDREYVKQYLNLAQKISDGSKIYIPVIDENQQNTPSNPPNSPKSLNAPNSLISINSSSLSELDTLIEIGAVRAQAIIDGRPYTRVEELVERKIIPQSVFEKNKDRLTL